MSSGPLILSFVVLVIIALGTFTAVWQYRKMLREAKNYERGLKMVPLLIHLPPSSEDLESSGRDQRDLTEEMLSQAQAMYNIISSTATRGFKSRIYGQRHISLEIMASNGLVKYYAVVPTVLVDVIRQAVAAAYPSARLEEVSDTNIFSKVGKISGTIGGEFSLKKSFVFPIATYQESKRDASRALLNALSSASKDDGVGIQFLIRPAHDGWSKTSESHIDNLKKSKGKKKGLGSGGGISAAMDIMEALWRPPNLSKEEADKNPEDKQLTALEQSEVESISEKTRYPAYETLIRVVVSSNTAARSQVLLKNIIAAFALFDSPRNNGFRFSLSRNIEEMTTSYIMRFFPQHLRSNILNSVEMATLFHLPSSSAVPTAQVKRQMAKQVDGPTDIMEEGILVGYNEFRGTKKPIRIGKADRRRHVYIIGQTGTGKSVLQENMAYQDMMDGRGFAFIDPHGDSVETLLGKVPKERVEDIIYFNPSDMENPVGLNMFEYETEDQKDFVVQEGINMLQSMYDPNNQGFFGARAHHMFRNAALLLMADPEGGTFIDVVKCFIDPEFVKSKLKYVTDHQVIDYWTKEFPASQRSSEAGEVVTWFVSKWGPFISNQAMRNILGQTKSGFNLRDIMDNRKILLVNLSKGKMGDLNSKLLGTIFVMKFQAAAMSRANIAEDEREDFSLYVDEFQNFATESFETIMSEARKYRLSLIMGNQFMTQLTDQIREAIIGNVGTVISGRIGVTDAELLVKKFQPVFDIDDLTKMPNFQSIATVMINNVPSAPFSMNWVPPMGSSNSQLRDALVRLSAAKYGRPRGVVEREIFQRLGRDQGVQSAAPAQQAKPVGQASFLDEWLAKRQQLGGSGASAPKRPAGQQQPGVKPMQQQSAPQPSAMPPTAPIPAGAGSAGGFMADPARSNSGGGGSSQGAPTPAVDFRDSNQVSASLRPNNNRSGASSVSGGQSQKLNKTKTVGRPAQQANRKNTPSKPKPKNHLDLRGGGDQQGEVTIRLR